jgi:putative FmdB family regulatory protein
MATYDFYCPECDDVVEVVYGMNDPQPEVICETCGKNRRKKFTSPPLNIKGEFGGADKYIM